jgi:hypothetical protein
MLEQCKKSNCSAGCPDCSLRMFEETTFVSLHRDIKEAIRGMFDLSVTLVARHGGGRCPLFCTTAFHVCVCVCVCVSVSVRVHLVGVHDIV